MRNSRYEDLIRVSLLLDNRYKDGIVADEIHFLQTWGSTALGFGGFGGDMMTSAWTSVIIKNDGSADVYFNGKKAYSVEIMNDAFKKDLLSRCMKPVYDVSSYTYTGFIKEK